jgi:hypothetical protein
MKNYLRNSLTIIVFASLLIVTGGATANAASANITGTTSMTGWVIYPTVRTTTGLGRISLTPNNLFKQNSSGSLSLLTARVVDDQSPVTWSSNAKTWDQTNLARQTFISGIASNSMFRMSATGYVPSSNDTTWGGVLDY